ncbi:MAG: hypothetical protein FJY86_03885 [Candidatus Diapherotrites archaeon]|uniref:Uncharacterized protein n=1 Tax=Candidatus Iainarchaeum sp. TaxID=3101447 RepID=A0A8T4C8Z6_9ARCH|nr:hypothetical protein [Candidatus Diapherotrites archaeon]
MNRTILSVFALASILFLFGSLVVAETGSGSSTDAEKLSEKELKELKAKQLKAKLTTAVQKKEIKKFEVESMEAVKARAEAIAAQREAFELKIKNVSTLPAWITDDMKSVLAEFGLDAATLEKLNAMSATERETALKELRIRYESKLNDSSKAEIKLRLDKASSRAKEIAAALSLDGSNRYKARLEIAIKVAEENGNTELAAKLTALQERLAAKREISSTDAKEVDDSLLENRIADFKEKAPKAISLGERVSSRLADFITRLDALIAARAAEGLNTSRLDAGMEKLTNVQSRLDEQIDITQKDWDAFVAQPSRDTLKAVHFDLVKLKVLARHALQDMKVMLRYYKHFSEKNGADDDAYDAYDDSLTDEVELETILEVEATAAAETVVGSADVTVVTDAAAETITAADDNPSADDLSGETDDSGVDGDGDGEDGDDNGGDDE